ncbi:hypothetical protein [Timonella sp. A28]|uniref:hypothetical protein n=1 Tax=Timonella sp. A28 TaxID=3442640 RepID=UPI003EC03CAD
MSSTLVFPSEAFPQFPRIEIERPEGWNALAAVGLPLALAKDVPAGVFRPNVLVTLTRLGADHTVDQARKAFTAKTKALPRYKEESSHVVDREDCEGFTVEGRFAGGRGEIIHQIVTVMVINRGYVFDVVEITGTCSALTGDNGKKEIREILSSVHVDISGS